MTTHDDDEARSPLSPPYRIEIEALAVAMERAGSDTNGVGNHLDPARGQDARGQDPRGQDQGEVRAPAGDVAPEPPSHAVGR